MSYDRELAVALEAVHRAERILLAEYANFQAIPNAPADISTHADRVSQDIILEHLHTAFPDDALCAEEATAAFAGVPQTGSRVWIVDPIDGTRGFARKNGEFSIMVALVDGARVVVGVVFEPVRDRLTYAVRGGGCSQRVGAAEAARCRVTATAELAAATLTQS